MLGKFTNDQTKQCFEMIDALPEPGFKITIAGMVDTLEGNHARVGIGSECTGYRCKLIRELFLPVELELGGYSETS